MGSYGGQSLSNRKSNLVDTDMGMGSQPYGGLDDLGGFFSTLFGMLGGSSTYGGSNFRQDVGRVDTNMGMGQGPQMSQGVGLGQESLITNSFDTDIFDPAITNILKERQGTVDTNMGMGTSAPLTRMGPRWTTGRQPKRTSSSPFRSVFTDTGALFK